VATGALVLISVPEVDPPAGLPGSTGALVLINDPDPVSSLDPLEPDPAAFTGALVLIRDPEPEPELPPEELEPDPEAEPEPASTGALVLTNEP
jgi:hypothetical protein